MQGGKPRRFDVVISGASLAGLSLALALSHAFRGEIRVAIIDRTARPGPAAVDVRAFALSAASKQMLDVLGVWQRVAEHAQPVAGIDITDSGLDAGIRPVLLSYENKIGAQPASFIVPSAVLSRELAALMAADKSATFVAPAEAASFQSSVAGVDVALADGQTLGALLLVAAEGRKSPLRDAAGIKLVGWSFEQTGIVATVAHERPHIGRAVQHFLPGGPFAILPL